MARFAFQTKASVRFFFPCLADGAAREHEHLLRPLGDIRRNFLDALEVRLLAELDCAVDPFDQPAEASALDHLAAMTAASGMHLFSGAPDEKPRVDYLTTLQYHGFSYHVPKPTGCGH